MMQLKLTFELFCATIQLHRFQQDDAIKNQMRQLKLRNYDYEKEVTSLLTPEIVTLLTQIHEYKGEQSLFIEAKADILTQLMEIAKIQSTEASNRIEGISTSDERLKAIVKDKTTPKSRNEKEIAGYRDVLNTIHENHDYIVIKPNMILQLHRDLYKFEGYDFGGKYKTGDNIIEEVDEQGNKHVRFQPVSAWGAPEAVENLCRAFNRTLGEGKIDPLLLIPMFILDFLCIHPFNDGNGRISRLLTLLCLYRAGYIVGKYISIEQLIERTKESYYDALQESSVGWHEEENAYAPFVQYMLGVVVAAYRDFTTRVQTLAASGLPKPERIARIIEENYGEITKAQIAEKCPDISQITIERTLADLLGMGRIIKIGGGRYTKYVWNREKDS